MLLRFRLLRDDELRRFGAAHAFSRHLANYLGSGENFLFALARHRPDAGIFAHPLCKSAIILSCKKYDWRRRAPHYSGDEGLIYG